MLYKLIKQDGEWRKSHPHLGFLANPSLAEVEFWKEILRLRRLLRKKRGRSVASLLKDGPVFRLTDCPALHASLKLTGTGKGIGKSWEFIGLFKEAKYARLLMKAITLKAR